MAQQNLKDAAWTRYEVLLIAAACGLMGLLSAVAVWQSPYVCFFVLAGFLGAASVVAVLGTEAMILLALMVAAFLLMNRFDEGWAILLGEVSLKTFYILMSVSLLAIAVLVRSGQFRSQTKYQYAAQFYRSFLWLWTLFVILAGIGLLANHIWDQYVPMRDLTGEILALGAIVLPMLFALWIPFGGMSRRRTWLCIQGLIGLGGLAGLIMMIFGMMPDYILGRLGWLQAIGGTSDLVRGRLPLGHPNLVAAVMLLLIPLVTILALGGGDRRWRLFYIGCLGAMFCGVLFTLSRSALLNMSLVMALTIAYMVFAPENRRVWSVLVLIAFVALMLIAGMYLFARYDFSRLWSRGYHEDASVGRRAESMRTAVYVWWDHPLIGASPDAVYTRLGLRPGWTPAMEDSISPILVYRSHLTAETPHNMYLTLMAEFGVLGTLCYLGILFVVGQVLWNVRKIPGILVSDRRILTGLGIGLIAFLLVGLFEAVLMVGIRVNVVFWIMAALSLRYAFWVARDADDRSKNLAAHGTGAC